MIHVLLRWIHVYFHWLHQFPWMVNLQLQACFQNKFKKSTFSSQYQLFKACRNFQQAAVFIGWLLLSQRLILALSLLLNPIEFLPGSTLDSALVTSVTNTPVTISPEQNNEVTTDVTVTFDGGATDDISGSNLWRVEVWYSKKEDGSGFRSSYTQQALSPSQQRQAIRGNTLRFNVSLYCKPL